MGVGHGPQPPCALVIVEVLHRLGFNSQSLFTSIAFDAAHMFNLKLVTIA